MAIHSISNIDRNVKKYVHKIEEIPGILTWPMQRIFMTFQLRHCIPISTFTCARKMFILILGIDKQLRYFYRWSLSFQRRYTSDRPSNGRNMQCRIESICPCARLIVDVMLGVPKRVHMPSFRPVPRPLQAIPYYILMV